MPAARRRKAKQPDGPKPVNRRNRKASGKPPAWVVALGMFPLENRAEMTVDEILSLGSITSREHALRDERDG